MCKKKTSVVAPLCVSGLKLNPMAFQIQTTNDISPCWKFKGGIYQLWTAGTLSQACGGNIFFNDTAVAFTSGVSKPSKMLIDFVHLKEPVCHPHMCVLFFRNGMDFSNWHKRKAPYFCGHPKGSSAAGVCACMVHL